MPDAKKLEKAEIEDKSTSRRDVDKSAERIAKDQSYGHRSLVKAWKEQQNADRKMRGRYANILITILSGQIIAINLFFLLMGFKALGFEADKWLAQSFIITSFLEICSLVLIVAKYLFPPATDKALDVIAGLNSRSPRSLARPRGHHSRGVAGRSWRPIHSKAGGSAFSK